MINTEKDVDRLLSTQLRKHGLLYKIENYAMVGMPDFYFSNSDKVAWIENKVIPSALSRVKFRSGQVQFLNKNWGIADTFVLVFNKNNNTYYLFSGLYARLLQDNKFDHTINFALFIHNQIKEISEWIVNYKKN